MLKFRTCQIEKPWGRTELPAAFGPTDGRKIGEIWFESRTAEELPLLVKYIFTSEKLSIQVHPDDDQARARGFPRGKTECWYIVEAEPDAMLGLGLKQELSQEELRNATLDGSIEHLINWVPVVPGEFFFVPAGMIHAIGAGIALVEFQQNSNVTYRLYDYGRPRELHVEEAVAAASLAPLRRCPVNRGAGAILVDTAAFRLARISNDRSTGADCMSEQRRWVIPLVGSVTAGADRATPGECLLVGPGIQIDRAESAILLIGAEGVSEDG